MNLTAAEWRAISERLYMMDGTALRAALDLDDDTYARDLFDDVKALAKALARVSPQHLAQLTPGVTHVPATEALRAPNRARGIAWCVTHARAEYVPEDLS